jgi:hypothetical protein
MFEFEGDKGTGQGPTMQFFTKVAEHLSREGRGLWRGDLRSVTTPTGEKKVTHVKVPAEGLYPRLASYKAAKTMHSIFAAVLVAARCSTGASSPYRSHRLCSRL